MTTSFFVPVSFQRYDSHSVSQTVLWADGGDGNSNDVLESLDYFVSVIESLNKKHRASEDKGETFQIVSRGSNDLPQNENTKIKVLYDPARMEIFIAIFQENFEIDISKICDLYSNDHIVSVPTDIVQSVCGFPIETLPPLGHHLASSISSCTIILDETLVNNCKDNLYMICGAGHPYWKLLLTEKTIGLLKDMDGVRIADVIMSDDEEINDHNVDHKEDQVWQVSSSSNYGKERKSNLSSSENSSQSKGPDQFYQKPYFPIDGPSINIARLVVREKDISNPFNPVFLTAVGRIGSISIRTKRSLRCEFLPPSRRKQNTNEMNEQDASYPWSSAIHNRSMTVDILFGKVLLQSLGTKEGERLIETIQEGQLLQIEAKTNPGQRESIENWVDKNCLELTMMDCQFLSPDLRVGNDQHNDNGTKSGKKKKIGTYSSLPTLALDDIFDKSVSVKFVNNFDSVSDFSNDVSKVLSRPYSEKDPISTSPLLGIDCEWQPREFMENPKLPQPVLLLQISFHGLQRVYLLDLQALLRPLRPPNTPMNDVENEVSNALSLLMESKQIIKVGYQLSSDLGRMFASYPHLPCFREVYSTLEISSFIKRVLHISKQKKSRYITMSLAAMTSHYLGMTLNKEHQLTDWAVRDLTPEQLEYAALDAAVTPKLIEKVLESIEAKISMDHLLQQEAMEQQQQQQKNGTSDDAPLNGPVVRRWNDDDALAKEIASWRFLLLPKSTDETTIGELQAKQIVGPSWIASSVWTAVQDPPEPYVLPSSR